MACKCNACNYLCKAHAQCIYIALIYCRYLLDNCLYRAYRYNRALTDATLRDGGWLPQNSPFLSAFYSDNGLHGQYQWWAVKRASWHDQYRSLLIFSQQTIQIHNMKKNILFKRHWTFVLLKETVHLQKNVKQTIFKQIVYLNCKE